MSVNRVILPVGVAVLLVAGVVIARVYMNQRLEGAMLAVKEENYVEAFGRASLLARLGDSDAQYLLGQLYAFGWGVPRDDATAIEWFRRAAKWACPGVEREAPAEFFVGERYERGVGLEPDEGRALEWYRLSASGGYGPARERVRILESKTRSMKRVGQPLSSWRRS